MDEESHEVRLYSNRRLYDRVQRRYIKFDDLYTLLLNGARFSVKDQQNNRDYTHRLLIDLLLRRESQLVEGEPQILTTVFLELFIRSSNSDAAPLLAKFLDHTARTLFSNTTSSDPNIVAPDENSYSDGLSEPSAMDP